jgi:hypothetical protein
MPEEFNTENIPSLATLHLPEEKLRKDKQESSKSTL